MKKLSLISLIVFAMTPLMGFEGTYFSSNNREITFFQVSPNQLIATTEVKYVDHFGNLTGEKIEYHFSFDLSGEESNQVFGKMDSFDSHYNCLFENGPAQLTKKPDGTMDLVFNKITFKVRKHYHVRSYLEPVYCYYYDYGYRHRYICDRRLVEVQNPLPFKRECVVTSRNQTGIKLYP